MVVVYRSIRRSPPLPLVPCTSLPLDRNIESDECADLHVKPNSMRGTAVVEPTCLLTFSALIEVPAFAQQGRLLRDVAQEITLYASLSTMSSEATFNDQRSIRLHGPNEHILTRRLFV